MEKQQSIHTITTISCWVRRSFAVQPAVKNDLSDQVLAAGIPSKSWATCPCFVHCCDLLFHLFQEACGRSLVHSSDFRVQTLATAVLPQDSCVENPRHYRHLHYRAALYSGCVL